MGNYIQIFDHQQFGKIRVAGTSDKPLFCLADICNAVNFTNPSQIKSRLEPQDVQLIDLYALNDLRAGNSKATFVTENGFYDIIIYSNSPKIKPFRQWVMADVLPSIRKHGAYLTKEAAEKALTDPDFIIQLATQIKEEREKSKLLTQEIQHKEQVIEGLVEDIPLADMRQRITQIIRKNGVSDIRGSYHLLYNEFNAKYHINVYTRMNNVCYKGNAMDYIENELEMLPQLYDLTCKLFEESYDSLMKSWGKSAKRAEVARGLAKRKLLS